MSYPAFPLFDVSKAKTQFKDSISSWFGVIGSVIMVVILLVLCIPLTSSYFQGIYHQSLFISQLPISTNFYIPDTFRLAIVIYDRNTRTVANHAALRNISTFNSFLNSITGSSFTDGVQNCDPNYFANTINPVILKDCFMYSDKKMIEFISSTTNPVSFGFQTAFSCNNPWSCAQPSSSLTTAQNNFADVFTNYTFSLYFTSKVFTKEGTF